MSRIKYAYFQRNKKTKESCLKAVKEGLLYVIFTISKQLFLHFIVVLKAYRQTNQFKAQLWNLIYQNILKYLLNQKSSTSQEHKIENVIDILLHTKDNNVQHSFKL